VSINSCSINEHTINTLCGSRRQAIIDSLRPKPPIVITGGGSQQHVRSDIRLPLTTFRRDRDEDQIQQTELSHVQVSVEFMGKSYSQTIKRDDNIPFVTVYGVSASEKEIDIDINISNIQVKVL